MKVERKKNGGESWMVQIKKTWARTQETSRSDKTELKNTANTTQMIGNSVNASGLQCNIYIFNRKVWKLSLHCILTPAIIIPLQKLLIKTLPNFPNFKGYCQQAFVK